MVAALALVWGLMALFLGLLAVLLLRGTRRLRAAAAEPLPEGPWPPVALIIPVKGAPPSLAANLASLLEQDYPDLYVILVTQDQADPACPVIEKLIAGRPRASLVQAGPTRSRAQKNHNLLAGLAAAPPQAQVLAFCDSGHLARPDWLRHLVRPLLEPGQEVASGYHQVIPGDSRLPTLGQAICVWLMYLGRTFSLLDQPWGGATAMTRRAFQELEIEQLWSNTVVDDVTLAQRLLERRQRLALAAGASLETHLAGQSWQGWAAWLHRQWIYPKFIMPQAWLGIGLAALGLFGLTLLAVLQVILALAGLISGLWGAGAGLYLALLTALAWGLHRCHPAPGPLLPWLAAFFTALAMGAWCHFTNWPVNYVDWGGVRYQVGPGGRVKSLRPL